PVLGPVAGDAEDHLPGADRGCELAGHVPPGPTSVGCPFRTRTVVHGEPVVMLSDRHHEPGSGAPEKLRPLLRIESLAGESVDQVLVPEALMVAVDFPVVLVLRAALHVH